MLAPRQTGAFPIDGAADREGTTAGPSSPVRGLLFLKTHGTMLAVRWRTIVTRSNGEEQPLPRGVRTIIAAGRGFTITAAAIKAISAANIELLISDDDAAFVSLFTPEPIANASRAALALRRRQFEAVLSPEKTAAIVQKIVAAKVEAEGHAPAIERGFLAALRSGTDDVRHVEAKAAQAFWRQWTVLACNLPGRQCLLTGFRSPAGTSRPQGRLGELAAQFTPRDAINPMQAMSNYAIGVLAARMTRVVIARGLDPCLVFCMTGESQAD